MEIDYNSMKLTVSAATRNFENSAEYVQDEYRNTVFIRSTITYLKSVCKANGWITVNDIWDALGLPRTRAGMVYGYTSADEITIDYRRGFVTIDNYKLLWNEIEGE